RRTVRFRIFRMPILEAPPALHPRIKSRVLPLHSHPSRDSHRLLAAIARYYCSSIHSSFSSQREVSLCHLMQLLIGLPDTEVLKRSPPSPLIQICANQVFDPQIEFIVGDSSDHRQANRCFGTEPSTKIQVVGLNFLAVATNGRSLNSDIPYPVLATGVSTTIEMEPKIGDFVSETLLQVFNQGRQARLGISPSEITLGIACTGHTVTAYGVYLKGKTKALHSLHYFVDTLFGNPGKD